MSATEPSDLEARVRALVAKWTRADLHYLGVNHAVFRSRTAALLALLDDPEAVGSGACDCGLPSMHTDWGLVCAKPEDFDPATPLSAVEGLNEREVAIMQDALPWPVTTKEMRSLNHAAARIVAERVATAKAEGAAEVCERVAEHVYLTLMQETRDHWIEWMYLDPAIKAGYLRDARAALGDGR